MEFVSGAVTEQCSNQIHVNQDKYGAVVVKGTEGNDVLIALVCDGVSRSYRSEIASYNTVLYVLQWAHHYYAQNVFEPQNDIHFLDGVLKKCNDRINRFSEKSTQEEYSCCTVSGFVTDGQQMIIFNAGDSRIYEADIVNDKLYLLTKDDKAEDGHSISMCIGAFENTELTISYTIESFNQDSVYIICTDGMYRRINFKKWGHYLFSDASRHAMEEHLRQMVRDVRNAGEQDDVTALTIVKKG